MSSVAISKVLSSLIILGSFTVKLPIIRNCVNSNSTDGLSETSLVFEMLSITLYTIYYMRLAFPLSTYGELLSITVQNYILFGCFWYYNPTNMLKVSKMLSAYVGLLVGLLMIPQSLMFVMPVIAMFMSWSSTIPLILNNFGNKSTGNLSIVTQGMVAFGAVIRLLTILIEVGDFVTIFGSIIGVALHNILLGQIIFYTNFYDAKASSVNDGNEVVSKIVSEFKKNIPENVLNSANELQHQLRDFLDKIQSLDSIIGVDQQPAYKNLKETNFADTCDEIYGRARNAIEGTVKQKTK